MNRQDLIDLGFKRTELYLTYYLGGKTFLHAHLSSDSSYVNLFYGYSIEIDNCMPMWHAPRNIETLIKLLDGLTGINHGTD